MQQSQEHLSTQGSNPARSTPIPRDKQNKLPRKYPSIQNLSNTSPRTAIKPQPLDNNNLPRKNSNSKEYTSPYSIKAIKSARNAQSPRENNNSSLKNSSRNTTLHKNTKYLGSTPNIHTKGLKSTSNSKISSWVSVPNVSHKPSNRTQVSPRDRNNALKKKQAYSCSSLNKHPDPSNQMKNYDKCSRESISKLRHSSPALSSKKTSTRPPMRFGLN